MTAQFWKQLPNGHVQCSLCRRSCVIPPSERGFCGVRANNDDGVLHSLVVNGVGAMNLDPVEKKPLYHYLPGTRTLSFGTPGCNFACLFCQNAALSHDARELGHVRLQKITPQALVEQARRNGAASLSFTYSEPTVFFELMAETADLALQAGFGTVLVSNGFQSPDSLKALQGRIQAANIDLKSFREEFYRKYCKAHLVPVLDNLKAMRACGWWLEVTTLLIPGCNDGSDELRELARFVAQELGQEVPWHISRFRPTFRMKNVPPTPLADMERAAQIGQEEGLRFVYLGNVAHHTLSDTFCPACGRKLLSRTGFSVAGLPFDGRCACGEEIPGVWSAA
ncbi:MAG: AmmeMemoRadiSam system radical SAM enzyme [Betaproteobacteria bacterium]|nr:AmmeMemoRadiSam system radical SAM enzyme [Betaproteobacteria bacterium]